MEPHDRMGSGTVMEPGDLVTCREPGYMVYIDAVSPTVFRMTGFLELGMIVGLTVAVNRANLGAYDRKHRREVLVMTHDWLGWSNVNAWEPA